jgi:hypothetical protein
LVGFAILVGSGHWISIAGSTCPAPRSVLLLAMLVVHANELVSTDRLTRCSGMHNHRPPPRPRCKSTFPTCAGGSKALLAAAEAASGALALSVGPGRSARGSTPRPGRVPTGSVPGWTPRPPPLSYSSSVSSGSGPSPPRREAAGRGRRRPARRPRRVATAMSRCGPVSPAPLVLSRKPRCARRRGRNPGPW